MLSVLAVPNTWGFITWGLYKHLRNYCPAEGKIRKDGEQAQEWLVDQSHIATLQQPHTASTEQLCPANGFFPSSLTKAEVGVLRGDGAQGGIHLLPSAHLLKMRRSCG